MASRFAWRPFFIPLLWLVKPSSKVAQTPYNHLHFPLYCTSRAAAINDHALSLRDALGGSMQKQRIITVVALLILALIPLSVYAQRPVIFTSDVIASTTVHRGPGTEHTVVGYLEPGMPVRVFACNADCSWLDIGPNVWIDGRAIAPPDGLLPLGMTLPSTGSAPEPTATAVAPTAIPQQAVPSPDTDQPPPPPTATQAITATVTPAPAAENCEPSYPDFCLAPGLPDLDCNDIPYDNFTVLPPDPHDFDREGDGLGCETG
jgi:hypothetical protein